MQLPVFEHTYLLNSVGWAIASSFWQTGTLWLLYQFITTIDKKLPAILKYHFSIVLLITSFTWFVFSIVHNYLLLTNAMALPETNLIAEWILTLQPFNKIVPFLSIAYLVLLCFFTIQFFKNLSANLFLQREGLTKAPVDVRLFTTYTALHLGIKKKVQVWLSEYVDVPSMTGFIKPIILLPAAIINHLSMQQIEAVLLHELAHIKRNDYLVNLLQSMVEIILFFNPFAILLSKAAKNERENCCDDWVLYFQYDQYEYANALLVLEEQRQLLPFRFALAATNGKKNLLQRVKRLFITHPHTDFSSLQKLKLVGLCFFLLTAMFTVLPYIINKPPDKARIYNKKEKLNLLKLNKLPEGNFAKNVFSGPPIKSVNEKSNVTTNRTKKQLTKTPDQGDYVNVFINEELLKPTRREPIATMIVDKGLNNSKYFIKIEEQQSGKKQINTYYFELDNINGNAAIKPLIIFNKFKPQGKKTILKGLPDSVNITKKGYPKKRVTS